MLYKIKETTAQIITELYRDGQPDKALLASLRNAPTIASQHAQAVWPLLMAKLNESQLSQSGVPTRAEVAVYTAIRFYAIHQQANHTQSVYASAYGHGAEGETFFAALARLRGIESLRKAMDRRVQPLFATTNAAGIINELSHLVSILKANGGSQKVDYAWLAQDLYGLQGSYEQASQVRLRWGQQYFWVKQSVKVEGEKTND